MNKNQKTYHSIRTIYSIHINFCYKSYKWRCFWILRPTFYFKAVYSVFINCLRGKERGGTVTSGSSTIIWLKQWLFQGHKPLNRRAATYTLCRLPLFWVHSYNIQSIKCCSSGISLDSYLQLARPRTTLKSVLWS